MPRARDIAPVCGLENAHLSDLFLKGYVYKPLCFDLGITKTRDEYKILGQIKSSKYISCEILQSVKNTDALITMLGQNKILVFDGYITGLPSPCLPETLISAKSDPPTLQRLLPSLQFEFYAMAKDQICIRDRIRICDMDFKVCDISQIEVLQTERALLTSDICQSVCADKITDADIFRTKMDSHVQYLSGGAVFCKAVAQAIESRPDCPFLMYF